MGRDEAAERGASSPLPAARWDAISRIAAGLSHEVRNPLNALAIHLEVLADKLRAGGSIPAHLEKNLVAARAQVSRVDGIVRRFTEFAAARDFAPAQLDARSLVEEVAGLCRHEAGRHGVEFLAMAPEGLLLEGGPLLTQVLVALAIGILDGGVGGGRLLLAARAEGDRAAISLGLEGGGLDLPVARAAIAGSGVGRGSIEGIVAQLDGEVTVEAAGAGVTVTLRVPLARRERSGAVA